MKGTFSMSQEALKKYKFFDYLNGGLKMTVSLISNDLLDRFKELLEATEGEINIISPFIGMQTAYLLADWLEKNPGIACNLITRFYREEFIERVSSIYGLERMVNANVNIYALVNLHSKLYLFDSNSTIIGSANFTKGGFVSNHEICVLLEDEPEIADKAQEYFFDLLEKIQATGDAGRVTREWIEEEKKYVPHLAANQKDKTVTYSNDKKRGAELKKIVHSDLFESILENTIEEEEITGLWLKFEGTGDDRIPSGLNYREMKGVTKRELNATYFPRRPAGIVKEDTLFLTIVSYDEHDKPTPMIIGYAKSNGFDSRNVVTDADIKETPWKHRFPFFVEFTEGKVINAPISQGIRLVDLYNGLGKTTFPTLRKRKNVSQKTLQSMHYRRSHIRITREASDFIIEELNKRFKKYGEIIL